jgi:peptidoglycan/LPS O-acetylase OafA/YrhL
MAAHASISPSPAVAPRALHDPADVTRIGRAAVLPEIQALRAIAVLLVLIYHLWPASIPGGFVGVDVFFAISGFLITSHLLREVDRWARVSLTAFWARRARRLLPAALMVLLVCAIATLVFVPLTYWQRYLAEIRASTGYVQNWHLAAAAVDYFAADNAPSPVQHYWSLSAEEQFYLVWPLLIGLATWMTRGRPRRVRRRAIATVLSALTALSLAYSISRTAAGPAAAYFVTPTRAWEFGAGGLLALLPRSEGRVALRSALSWLGIAAIALAASAYSVSTAFPGYAALLPVLGALAVMRAGAPPRRWAPTPVLRLPPVQFVGDVSYSIYLWHWPLIILAPFVTHRGVDTSTRITILMLTILAAWLTKALVEDPMRAGRLLTARRAGWTFVSGAAGMAVVFAVTATGSSRVQAQVRKDERQTHALLAAKPDCFGAAARDPEHPCDNPRLRLRVVPTPVEAHKMANAPCKLIELRARVQVCEFGVPRSVAAGTVALVGDSHASHWRAALEVVARAKRWRGLSVTHTSCPFSTALRNLPEPDRTRCIRWKRDVPRWFRTHPEISTVFVSQLAGGTGVVTRKGQDRFVAEVEGYIRVWNTLPATVRHIIVIRDTPKVRGDTDVCVERAMARHEPAGPACAVRRASALDRDPAAVAANRVRSPRVQVIDLTAFLCDQRPCYPVIGGALVYKDQSHLTAVFGKSLGPYVLRELDGLMAGWA